MRKLAFLAIAGLPLLALAQPAYAQQAGDKVAGSYICVFNKGSVSRGNAQAEANRAAAAGGAQLTHVYRFALQGFAANMSAQAAEQMRARNPNIAYCEQDQVAAIPPVRIAAKPSPPQPAEETPWGSARV